MNSLNKVKIKLELLIFENWGFIKKSGTILFVKKKERKGQKKNKIVLQYKWSLTLKKLRSCLAMWFKTVFYF